MREIVVEEETKAGATCDMCGRPAGSTGDQRLYSFLGTSWIKLHAGCMAWMGLKLHAIVADERIKSMEKSKPVLRLVGAASARGKK